MRVASNEPLAVNIDSDVGRNGCHTVRAENIFHSKSRVVTVSS